jgi:hypothetical protein
MLNEDSISLEDNNSIMKEDDVKENKSLSDKQETQKPKFMFSGIKVLICLDYHLT